MEAREGKLLLVEDDANLQRWLPEALGDHGFEVGVCGSVSEAQERLRTAFDLVLLDLGLPDGDGLEVCLELRSRGDRTPIVILTARDAPDELVRGLDAGADVVDLGGSYWCRDSQSVEWHSVEAIHGTGITTRQWSRSGKLAESVAETARIKGTTEVAGGFAHPSPPRVSAMMVTRSATSRSSDASSLAAMALA